MKKITRAALAAGAAVLAATAAWAADPEPSFDPAKYDSVVADPKNHIALYEDSHVRLLEVTIWPGDPEDMHGHDFYSVFTLDAVQPKAKDTWLNRTASLKNVYKEGGPPPGQSYPTCLSASPEAPHSISVLDDYPQRFYRLEFKRMDGDGLSANWKTWYPWMQEKGGRSRIASKWPLPAREAWPFPAAQESLKAAPDNHYLVFENDHIRLVEVVVRPGESEPMHGHAYAAVLAFDPASKPRAVKETFQDPASPLSKVGGTYSGPPGAVPGPNCKAMSPQALHSVQNLSDAPIHYYRMELKRVDGEAFKDHWREWYPDMAKGPRKP